MKRAVPVFLFAVLIAVFIGWVPNAGAYSSFSNCRSCHSIFSGPSPTHDDHAALAGNTCSTCHGGSINNNPSLNNCTQCHGRTQDAGGDPGKPGLGRGLRQHHQGGGFATCAGCHGDATGPPGVGENVSPSFYPGPANLNPCDGSEEQFPSNSVSLDNDGDGLTDGADSDCQVATAPQIDVNPASITFPDVIISQSSTPVQVTLTNTGDADLSVSGIAVVTGTDYSVAAGGSNACSNLTPVIAVDGNCTVQVTFSPTTVANNISDTLTITSDASNAGTVDIPLSGNGIAGPTPDIAVDPASFDFGSVTVGDNTSHVFTVSNVGTDNLDIGTINPIAAPFSILDDTCSGQSLEPTPAPSCTLTVQFAPISPISSHDTFDIPSNDPDENPITVTIDGTGTSLPVPNISVTDSTPPADDNVVQFGDVKKGTSLDKTVTVTNNGTADLEIFSVAFTDNLAAPFSIPDGMDNCSDTILGQSESCSVTVRFAPTELSAASDTFDIPSDDPDTPSVTVTVEGTGVANTPPTAPELVLPSDGATGLPTSVTFEWNESMDADGDPVTYNLFVCANDNTFATCPDPVNNTPITASASGGSGLAFAASGMGVMFFGVAFVAGIGRKKTVALLLALALATGVLLVACSDDDNGSSSPQGQVSFPVSNLSTGTTYYWKVVANDDSGGSTDSATRSFSTQ